MSSQPNEMALAKAPVNIGSHGVVLQDIEGLWRFAEMHALANNTQATKADIAKVAIIMQAGMEMGLRPMEAMANICVIKGRPSLWGNGIIAQLRRSGEVAEMKEYFEKDGKRLDAAGIAKGWDEGWVACFFIRLKCETEGHTERFSWKMAARAGLATKETYRQYPESMLMRKAISHGAGHRAAHLLAGVSLTDDDQGYPEVRKVESRPAKAPAAPDPLMAALKDGAQATVTLPAEIQVDAVVNAATDGTGGTQTMEEVGADDKAAAKPKSEKPEGGASRLDAIRRCKASLKALYPSTAGRSLLAIVHNEVFGAPGWSDTITIDELRRADRILKQIALSFEVEKPTDEDALKSVIKESTEVVDNLDLARNPDGTPYIAAQPGGLTQTAEETA